jgi:hypothetical protein
VDSVWIFSNIKQRTALRLCIWRHSHVFCFRSSTDWSV